MPSLSDIELEISNIMSMPFEELDEEQKAEWLQYADELAHAETAKVDAIGQAKRLDLARCDAEETEGKRLIAKARARRNNWARFDEHTLQVMQANGVKRINGNVYSLSIRSTPIVRIDNEAAIPEQFWTVKTERTLSKIEIKNAIRAGQIVPGASMGESFSLQVR